MEEHLSLKVVGRMHHGTPTNRTCCGSAAYRCGMDIEGADGTLHRYNRKQGVLEVWQRLPENAPARYADIGTMWREADAAERRKDAQLYRDLEFAIPAEIPVPRACEMIDTLLDPLIRKGMAGTVAVHQPPNNPVNLHAHVMLTMREMTPDGFGGKAREWNRTDMVEYLRPEWAKICNAELQQMGKDKRVEHRSYAARGVDKLPTQHEGPAVTAMRRRGELTDRAAANDIITQLQHAHDANQHRAATLQRDVQDLQSTMFARSQGDVRANAYRLLRDIGRLRGKLRIEQSRNRKIAECWDVVMHPEKPENGAAAAQKRARGYLQWAGYDPLNRGQYRRWKQAQEEIAAAYSGIDRLDGAVREVLSAIEPSNVDISRGVSKVANVAGEAVGAVGSLLFAGDSNNKSTVDDVLDFFFGDEMEYQIKEMFREMEERERRAEKRRERLLDAGIKPLSDWTEAEKEALFNAVVSDITATVRLWGRRGKGVDVKIDRATERSGTPQPEKEHENAK